MGRTRFAASFGAGRSLLPGVLLSLLVFWLVGCQPAPPLEWKVDAATPADYNAWLEKTIPRLPPELAQEFTQAIVRLAAETPRFRLLRDERDLKSRSNPLCVQLDRRTIRQVIVAGCEASNVTLSREIKLGSDDLLAALKRGEKFATTATAEKRLDQTTAYRSAALDAKRAQVDANRARIKELSAPPR